VEDKTDAAQALPAGQHFSEGLPMTMNEVVLRHKDGDGTKSRPAAEGRLLGGSFGSPPGTGTLLIRRLLNAIRPAAITSCFPPDDQAVPAPARKRSRNRSPAPSYADVGNPTQIMVTGMDPRRRRNVRRAREVVLEPRVRPGRHAQPAGSRSRASGPPRRPDCAALAPGGCAYATAAS